MDSREKDKIEIHLTYLTPVQSPTSPRLYALSSPLVNTKRGLS
jgi:hypothetical protein